MTEKLTGAMKTLLNGAATICSVLAIGTFATQAAAETLTLEKDELKFGFIKLTDMAPLAIAKEKGFFEDEGLYVTLEPQANWKVLLDRVITGELDGAHMLAGQPLAATIGYRHQGAHRHALLDGPQRQRHHRLQRRLGDDEGAMSRRSRTASRCIRSRPTR